MITICPQCQLPLAVTASDLRIAQGQVRCGRCAAVFNALASLYEPGGVSAERRAAALLEATRAAAAASQAAATGPLAAASPGSAPGSVRSPVPGGAGNPQAPAQPPPFWSPVGSSPFAPRRGDAPAAPANATVGAPERTVALSAAALDASEAPLPDDSSAAPAPTAGAPTATASESAASVAPAASEPRALQRDTTILGPNSGLFRAPPRDDVPRFDDTHGADDWPDDLPEQLAAEAAAGSAGTSVEITDTFRREPDSPGGAEPRTDALALPAAPAPDASSTPAPHAPSMPAPRVQAAPPESPAPAAAPLETGRDWNIDTLTAAELADLVARGDADEPPELASIRIAVDEASEITVLPGDLPPAATQRELAPDASLPRLIEPRADDPDLPGALVVAEERRAALPDAAMRWLEIEPAAGPAAEAQATASGAMAESGSDGAFPAPWTEAPAADDLPADATTAATARARNFELASAPRLAREPAPDEAMGDGLVEELVAGAPARPVTPRWMLGGTVALALLLVAQLVHRYREELVEVPLLEAPLTALYAALGTPVQPRWDVGGYEVRQQGVVAEPVAAGTLTVRASIRNGAGRAQPAPLLRVILQDRFGNRIATRDLTPREYGGTAALAPAPMLAPGQRIDAEVSLLDPGGDAVGFELDVCLRRTDASVRCANDAPAANG